MGLAIMAIRYKEKYGDWALITGATSGIGAEIANQLADKGFNIVLVARKKQDLEAHTIAIKKKYGVAAMYISADLSTQEGMEKVTNIQKPIGLLVLAAGVEVNGAFEKTSLEDELQMVQLNVTSTLHLSHHFSKEMVARKKGGILFVASLAGHMVNPYFSNYAATKAYVLQLGASLYGELKPKGIDISVLSPGLTNTNMMAGSNVDWNKLPMKEMSPQQTAKIAIDGLPKRFLSIPGTWNKMLTWVANFSPLGIQAKINGMLIRRAINEVRL